MYKEDRLKCECTYISKPLSPPPFAKPHFSGRALEMDARMFRNHLYRYVYVWRGIDSFWFYPTDVRIGVIEGYKWNKGLWEHIRFNHEHIEEIF